jgi:hypothetical protein
MRKAPYDNGIIRQAFGGGVLGVALGFDFCAEHEWGIRKMLDRFGVTNHPRALGVKKRRITGLPSGFTFAKVGKRQGILLPTDFSARYDKTKYALVPYWWNQLHLRGYKGFHAAWDEESFCVTSDDKADKKALLGIYGAFLERDVAITLLAGTPFHNRGLAFIIASRISKDDAKAWHDADAERLRLDDYMRRTDIEKVLRKAKKGYFALVPHMKDGSVKFWLNPFEQDKYKAGYFDLADLLMWADDTGPVVKKPQLTAEEQNFQDEVDADVYWDMGRSSPPEEDKPCGGA